MKTMSNATGRLFALALSVAVAVSGCGSIGAKVDATPAAPGTAAAQETTATPDAGTEAPAERTDETAAKPVRSGDMRTVEVVATVLTIVAFIAYMAAQLSTVRYW